jgi:hypothetical protein
MNAARRPPRVPRRRFAAHAAFSESFNQPSRIPHIGTQRETASGKILPQVENLLRCS